MLQKLKFKFTLTLTFFLVMTILSSNVFALQKGETFPPLSATTLQGEQFDLNSLAGRPTLLKLGATWCPHCLKEAQEITKIKDWMSTQGVRYVEVFLGEKAGPVQKYLEGHNLSPDIVLLDSDKISRALQVRSIPMLVFIDADFKVYRIVTGSLTASDLQRTLTEMQ